VAGEWRKEPCTCLLCLYGRLSPAFPSLEAEAGGAYVVTRTHNSARATLCHPDGCPVDSRARQRIASRETVALPGARPAHVAGNQPDLCDRVACARLPEQQRRQALHGAMYALAFASPPPDDPFPALAARARRSKQKRTLDQLEFELRWSLRDAMRQEPAGPPDGLEEFPSLLAEFGVQDWRDRALEGARKVARLLPPTTFPAIDGLPLPARACEVRATGWDAVLELSSISTSGVLPALLRADARPDDKGLVFTVAPSDVPVLAWAWVWAREDARGYSLDGQAAAWAAENIPARPDDEQFAFPDACLAREWWIDTFGDDRVFPLPEMDPGCACADRRHVNAGEILADGTAVVALRSGSWRVNDRVSDGRLEAAGTETDPNTGTPSVEITSSAATFLTLSCAVPETMPMDSVADAVRQVARAYQPEPVQVTIDDLLDADRMVRHNLVASREDGTVWLRRPEPRPAAEATDLTDPGLLPPGFDRVLAQLRPVERGSLIEAWRQDAPWGIYGGPDLTPAADLAPDVWTPAVDAALTRLAAQYSGFAPSVFAAAFSDRFPDVVAAAAANTIVARSLSNRFEAGNVFGPVAALVFSRLLALTTWSMPTAVRCPLCATEFDPQLLDVRHVVQYGPVRWCTACSRLGWGSDVPSREEALTRIAHLASVLGSAPPRDWARQPVPHDVPAPDRDRLMAARMAMPDSESLRPLGLTNWGETLEAAGVLLDGLRTSRGLSSRAADGHWCRSMLELAVDDFLSSSGIEHECEPGWPQHPSLNPTGARRADWRLQDGTYVEAAGLMDDPAYAEKMSQKRLLAEYVGVRLVVVEPSDLNRLAAIFAEWMPPAER
jgi:hypothetical protein